MARAAQAAATCRLPSQVDVSVARKVMENCWAEVRSTSARTVDLGQVEAFDSSLVSVLLELRRRAHAAGVTLTWSDPPAKLLDLCRLYGVEVMLFGEATAATNPA